MRLISLQFRESLSSSDGRPYVYAKPGRRDKDYNRGCGQHSFICIYGKRICCQFMVTVSCRIADPTLDMQETIRSGAFLRFPPICVNSVNSVFAPRLIRIYPKATLVSACGSPTMFEQMRRLVGETLFFFI